MTTLQLKFYGKFVKYEKEADMGESQFGRSPPSVFAMRLPITAAASISWDISFVPTVSVGAEQPLCFDKQEVWKQHSSKDAGRVRKWPKYIWLMASVTCRVWHGHQRQSECWSNGALSTSSDSRSRVGGVEEGWNDFELASYHGDLFVRNVKTFYLLPWGHLFPPTMEASIQREDRKIQDGLHFPFWQLW